MQKIKLDIDSLVVSSFDTTEHDTRLEGTVFARSTADCGSDSGCPTALCTRDLYYYECRVNTAFDCTPDCGDHEVTP